MWTRTKMYLTQKKKKKPTQAAQRASALAAGSRAKQIERQRRVHWAAVCDHSCEMPPARLDWPSEVAAPYIRHLAPWLCADTRSCNPACFCLPSVYQPGLWWPPRILTVSLQVTRTHDGHSSVRRPLQTLQQQQQQKRPLKKKRSPAGPTEASAHVVLKINFAHVQTLPETRTWQSA